MYDKEKLYSLLTKVYKCIDDVGNVLPPSSKIYKKVAESMSDYGSKMSSKHVYTVLKTNRTGLYESVLEAFNIEKEIPPSEFSDTFSDSESSENNKSEVKYFRVVFSYDQWDSIKPDKITVTSRKRYYINLQMGKWTHLLASKIWQQNKICCAFSFKRAKVFESCTAKHFATFCGKCKECGGTLAGHIDKKPKKNADVIALFLVTKPIFLIRKRDI